MKKTDYLIVGSGAGGATLAREIAKSGGSALVLEAGRSEGNLGTFRDASRFYDVRGLFKMPRTSLQGAIIWRTLMAGGSTVVSCGNGVRCLEKELSELGIDIGEELTEAERDLNVLPMDDKLLSDGTRKIMQASGELGYPMKPMPKFIDPKACKKCGQCVLGCRHKAKWTALDYLEEAVTLGCQVIYRSRCQSVIVEKGRAKGVRISNSGGESIIMADVVVLAAGGLGTPGILNRSGIEKAGDGFFMDIFVNTYGTTDGLNQKREPVMSVVNNDHYDSEGFILSPFLNHQAGVRFMEMGIKGLAMRDDRLIGIMTKIRDEGKGRVDSEEVILKSASERDRQKLRKGSDIAREILLKAGAKKTFVSRIQGAHPGGTASIGKITDNNLQTEIENLYVCDASLLPVSPGLPPILTIVALAKRLAKHLTS